MSMITKRKIAVTCVAGVLLAMLYALIFSFSAQDAEASGSLSMLISERCVELFNSLSGKHWSSAVMKGFAEYFEHPIRKFAHFAEYACMGILVYALWSQWLKRGRGLYFLTVIWVFVSAAADEIHQLFVPGRYGSLADVLLDTTGGIFGLLLCVTVCKLYDRRRAKGKKVKV